MSMKNTKKKLFAFAIIGLLAGLGIGYGVSLYSFTETAPEYVIGIVYPLSGRLEWWGQEVLPILESAKSDIQSMLDHTKASATFKYILKTSDTSREGAYEAVKELIEEGAELIVGVPLSANLQHVKESLDRKNVPVISSASTASALCVPDFIFRMISPEMYEARIVSHFALELGYTKLAIFHRGDAWGNAYAEVMTNVYTAQGYTAKSLSFPCTHPDSKNYSSEVAQLSQMVSTMGIDENLLVYLLAWEGEDVSIFTSAQKDPILSEVRWFSSLLFPSLLSSSVVEFLLRHHVWGPEGRPLETPEVERIMSDAKESLGTYPHYEHLYMYDALMVAALTILSAESYEGETLANTIPRIANSYHGVTGYKSLDDNGDVDVEDLAFMGVCNCSTSYTYKHFAYYYSMREDFNVLPEPVSRRFAFCPQC